MTRKVLFVLTSHDTLGNTGFRTGSWLHELAAPYWVFRDRGYQVDLVSIQGGAAPLDPVSLEAPWLLDEGRRLLADAAVMQELATTRPIAAVSADGYDAIFLVGGTGTAWDFPKNAHVRRLVETLNARDAVVAGVCHGVLGLTAAMTPEGIFLLKARRVTGISNKEDELVGVATVVPVLPEEQLRRAGGLYLAAAPFAENVVSDGNVYTGQNPASARPLAEAILARLEHPKSAVAAG